ncbi:MAG: protein kinase [Armatimonadetes bacterium]|nr:protein kinase [Armatimonadota bacterium]
MPSAKAITDGDIVDQKYRVVASISHGGAAKLYEVEQLSLGARRALKLSHPLYARGPRAKTFDRTFENEIRLLSSITHRNVVKIVDAGEVEHAGKIRPFYVMELMPSADGDEPTLSALFRSISDGTEIIDCFRQVLTGLEYLHSQEILHCDIKPSNLLYLRLPNGELEVRIADLGCAKPLSFKTGDSATIEFLADTPLFGSHRYAPNYARELIGKKVSRALLSEFLPHLDLYCLGTTFCELVSQKTIPAKSDRDFDELLEHIKPNIKSELTASDLHLMKSFIRRLLVSDRNDPHCYRSASQALLDFEKLSASYTEPLGVPEFRVERSEQKVNLATHRVSLSSRAQALVDHPMFQRLRFQNQLNLVERVFPDAKHSRFAHSLATFSVVKQYVRALISDPTARILMFPKDHSLLLASALLHDIGHYPLAHALDDLCTPREATENLFKGRPPEFHSRMSRYFLNFKGTTAATDGSEQNIDKSLADILDEPAWGLDYRQVVSLIEGEGTSEVAHLQTSIIDGPIDADKVAYLTSDSLFTGVGYGSGVDLDALLDGLIAIPEQGDRNAQIGVAEKAIMAAESIVIARYHMYARVYWHHANRAMMAMIKYVARKLFIDATGFGFKEYVYRSMFMTDYEAVALLSLEFEINFPAESNPLVSLLSGGRGHYRRLIEITDRGKYKITYKHLIGLDSAGVEALRLRITNIISESGIATIDHASCVLLDIPRIDPEEDASREIFVRTKMLGSAQGYSIEPLSRISGVSKSVFENFQSLVKKIRVFVPQKVRDDLMSTGKFATVQNDILKMLPTTKRR